MYQARRYFFRILARAGIYFAIGSITAKAGVPNKPDKTVYRTFMSYLDTLIPDDDYGPGAVQLGIHGLMIGRAVKSPRYRALVIQGCRWLDQEAKKLGAPTFSGLSADARNSVVALAAAAKPNSGPKVFYQITRKEVFFHYYSRPSTWTSIGYKGPPQPDGFIDYASPPQPVE